MRDLPSLRREDALRKLQAVVTSTRMAEGNNDGMGGARAEGRLRSAVQEARDAGVAWGDIGMVLGIARGNAYQRYRRRPSPTRIEHRPPPPTRSGFEGSRGAGVA